MKTYIIFKCENCGTEYIAELPRAFRPYEIAHQECRQCGHKYLKWRFITVEGGEKDDVIRGSKKNKRAGRNVQHS